MSVHESAKHLQVKVFTGFTESHFFSKIREGMALIEKHPTLLSLIEADQKTVALRKKESRKKDKEWFSRDQGTLFDCDEFDVSNVIDLDKRGRNRMQPIVVFLFLLIRGYLGSIKDKKCYSFIQESKSLENFLFQYGETKIPSASTILENLNCLSEETLRALHKLTLDEARLLGLDDFKKLYFDSTRISANSAWPTESRTIADLMTRIRRGFEILREHEIKVNISSETDELLKKLQSYNKKIALNAGKKDSKKDLKKTYKKILCGCKKLSGIFKGAMERANAKINGDLLPSIREGIEGLIEFIEIDLHNVELCANNARLRVLKEQKVPAEQKVLGKADSDAEMIPKGTKPLVFGYKPQIGRSEKGFIVGVLVPQGSASDAEQMRPITDESIKNTTILPDVASYDDGYTNSKVRMEYLKRGIKVVSFSGSKGKKQLEEEWELPEYEEARNRRSMVESTMSILKGVFSLGRFTRRSRKNVTQEILTAAIFHNISLLEQLST